MGLSLAEPQIERLLCYLELLQRWNRAYNLTAVTNPLDMVQLHLLDSLSILPFLSGKTFIDVGTGPGLPGVPLAIALPEADFVLLDSNGKRVRFLFQAKTSLNLANIELVAGRAERYRPDKLFDGVISRAFTSLPEMVSRTRHLLDGTGKFYAMKGRYPDKELSELGKGYTVSACRLLNVPGVVGERHLVEIGISPVGIAL